MSVRHMLVVLTGIMITFGCSALCFSTWGLFQPALGDDRLEPVSYTHLTLPTTPYV